MELIVISQSKLKIMLTPPDMTHYELSTENMDCADEHTRRAFRHIFEDACTSIGFDTAGKKLLVQLYASREGGCEIFVTTLGDEDMLPPEKKSLTAPEEVLLRRVMESEDGIMKSDIQAGILPDNAPSASPEARTRTVAVTLPHMATLLTVCHRLKIMGYTGESQAYIEDTTATPAPAYLFLQVPDSVFRRRLPDRYTFLNEYGYTSDPEALRLYISEHGQVICKCDAVGTLGNL